MKHLTLKLAVLGTLGIVSAQSMATGLVAIPDTGFGSSAYTLCNTTGNFGSSIPTQPTTLANNTCAVFPANEATAPVTGFTFVTSAVRPVTINNTYTNFTNKTVGNVTEYVWRNAAQTECIYGAKFVALNVDYNPIESGSQYFEVNDIARGGFGSSGTVNAGYYTQAANASPIYRIGRTFTSVQHRAYKYDTAANKLLVGTNYEALPGFGFSGAINGEDSPIDATTAASTIAANQTADVDAGWIDFTLDSGYLDDDGGTNVNSAMTYVQAACTAAAPTATAGNIRLRQTAQEFANFIEASVSGFAP
ncbi:hypothetical protein MTYP_02576 [Methylophilaceae bacterium]|nr:hypothetical protein MTYP_02576 [Methylophilaceae bacterium]